MKHFALFCFLLLPLYVLHLIFYQWEKRRQKSQKNAVKLDKSVTKERAPTEHVLLSPEMFWDGHLIRICSNPSW